MKLAFVFPGQGSQSQNMLSELAAEFSIIQQTFAEASSVLNYDLWEIVKTGGEKLEQTEYVQPLLLTADIAVWRLWLEQNGKKPQFLAGHSLGEYAALVAATALDFADGLRLVAERGRLMQITVPQGHGAMLAIVGLNNEQILTLCDQARENQVLAVANYNSPQQIVLAGAKEACERALHLAEKQGAKLAKLLAVSVPSHCELMRPAALRLQECLTKITIHLPQIPIIHNADVVFYNDVDQIRDALVRQLFSPVCGVETILFMEQQGVTRILECGPGKVLTGLNKRIAKNITVGFLGLPTELKEQLEINF